MDFDSDDFISDGLGLGEGLVDYNISMYTSDGSSQLLSAINAQNNGEFDYLEDQKNKLSHTTNLDGNVFTHPPGAGDNVPIGGFQLWDIRGNVTGTSIIDSTLSALDPLSSDYVSSFLNIATNGLQAAQMVIFEYAIANGWEPEDGFYISLELNDDFTINIGFGVIDIGTLTINNSESEENDTLINSVMMLTGLSYEDAATWVFFGELSRDF